MGLIVKQEGERSKLQEKIAAELRDKAMRTAKIESTPPDLVDDSVYQEDMKKTTGLMSVWFLVFAAVAVAVIIAFATAV